ncbi:MAG: hypothetical protein LBH05_06600, partial [Deferribacteraceae bacterium]|nr:hypothetical protein [Deferribacteraceae bacterium]
MKKIVFLLVICLFLASTIYGADDTLKGYGASGSEDMEAVVKNALRDHKSVYSKKKGVSDRLLKPLVSDEEMITLNGKHFNAKVLCSGGSGDELAKLFFTIT